MKKWFQRLKNQKGMTLVELLAVVVILGIVAAIAVPSISGIIDNSKKEAHKSNALLIINSAKLGVVSNTLSSSDDIYKSSTSTYEYSLQKLLDKGLLDSIPMDPSIKGSSYDPNNSYVIYTPAATTSGSGSYSIVLAENTTQKKYYNAQSERSLNDGTAVLRVPAQ